MNHNTLSDLTEQQETLVTHFDYLHTDTCVGAKCGYGRTVSVSDDHIHISTLISQSLA